MKTQKFKLPNGKTVSYIIPSRMKTINFEWFEQGMMVGYKEAFDDIEKELSEYEGYKMNKVIKLFLDIRKKLLW